LLSFLLLLWEYLLDRWLLQLLLLSFGSTSGELWKSADIWAWFMNLYLAKELYDMVFIGRV